MNRPKLLIHGAVGIPARFRRLCAGLLAALMTVAPACGAPPTDLPLLRPEDLRFQGAFRLPASTFGGSSLNYSEGPIAHNRTRNSLFIVGHSHLQAVAEFPLPALVRSGVLEQLNMAAAPLQPFTTLLDRAADGNPEGLDRIGGLYHDVATGQLLVNAYEYYDAPGDNSRSLLAIRDADALDTAAAAGFHRFSGGAGHTSGWISPIPPEWRQLLGGDHIAGQSSGIPIISRTSVGPSAFAFTLADLTSADPVPDPVATITLLDFSLAHPLHGDLGNEAGDNLLWTHLSRAVYGFIAPGTRTYVTLGHSGGHAGGVCYKCTQDDGSLCGGYCAPQADDYSHYFWLWDLDDLLAVRNGLRQPWEVRPYAYGPFATPFPTRELGGGAFDPLSGLLYLTVQRADTAQGAYSNPPVVIAYSLDIPERTPAGGAVVPPAFLLLR